MGSARPVKLAFCRGASRKGCAPFFLGGCNGFLGTSRARSRGANHLLAMTAFARVFLPALFLCLAALPVSAQQKCFDYVGSYAGATFKDRSASNVCSALIARYRSMAEGWSVSGSIKGNGPNYSCSGTATSPDGGSKSEFDFSIYGEQIPCPEQCVSPLVEVNGKCSCPAGTKEETDATGLRQCKPDSVCSEMAGKPLGLPVTADYGAKSPSSLGRMIGNSSTTCFPGGCTVSGTVDGCWSAKGDASCNLTDVKFTGDKCDDKAPPGGCPSGSSPSQYAAGVCIPDENKCPAGSSPSKYASGVCIPDENPCPAGQAPSKYAAGVCVPEDDPNADGNDVHAFFDAFFGTFVNRKT